MTNRLSRDPDLDRLVEELNRTESASADTAPDAEPQPEWPAAQVSSGHPFEELLTEMGRRNASDLLLLAGSPAVFRIGGRLVRADAPVLGGDEIASMCGELMTSRVRERIAATGSADFSLRLGRDDDRRAWRFRVNIHRQRGTLAAAVRLLPSEIPTLSELNLPPSLADVVKPSRGLVLICGPTGSGKTTTLAALVGEINRNESRHVITIEDPIEYEHRNAQSVVEQIEIGRDAPSFAAALRASLRQDPDVILVGEMRDLDTVSTAVTAAETGHLILSTLHTSDAATAIHRIIDVFPPAQQSQIKHQLSLSLNAIIVQHLMPAKNNTRVVAVEVLLSTNAVRNHIRHDKLQNLASEITLGKRAGMISLEDSLNRLVRQGLISVDDARARSSRPDELESLLRS